MQVFYDTDTISPGWWSIWTAHTASTMLPLVRFINGTIMESVSKAGIAGATVSTNKSVSPSPMHQD